MKARIIGPASELGAFESLNFFGQGLTREWSADFKATPEVVAKLQANKYVEVKGVTASDSAFDHDGDGKPGGSKPSLTAESETVKARLDELGVSYAANASSKTLKGLLEKAEAAQAKAEEEAAEAQAEADRLAEEAGIDPEA